MLWVRKSLLYRLAVASLATLLFAGAAGQGAWVAKVPEKNRGRNNPFTGDAEAAKAGAKLFEQHCAQCHGINAEGRKGPNLRSHHMEHATAGELEWLLTNGSLKNGMPSWSRLPEPQRWQLVTYLKSIQVP